MRLAAVILALLLPVPGIGANPPFPLTKPGAFPPPGDSRLEYRFGWSGVEAGRGVFDFARTGANALRLRMEAASTGPARILWPMDAVAESVVREDTLLPWKLVVTEKKRKEIRRTEIHYQAKSLRRLRETISRKTDSKPIREKPKTVRLARARDLHAALLLVRSRPLRTDETIRILVFPGSAPYRATVRVAGRETIKVRAGTYEAIRLDLTLEKVRKDGQVEPHAKLRELTGWLSDDADRMLLRINADLVFGNVFCELVSRR